MIIGYARVSSNEQKLDLQLRALQIAGCNQIFQDHGQSGYDFNRSGLDAALHCLEPGSTFIVWRLDRLGRSLPGLIEVMNGLARRQVHFKSIMENIDTSSSGGMFIFHMMGALAEFERALISERTIAGLNVARARGKILGRPKLLSDGQIIEAFVARQYQGAKMVNLASRYGVSVRTMRRNLHTIAKAAQTESVLSDNQHLSIIAETEP